MLTNQPVITNTLPRRGGYLLRVTQLAASSLLFVLGTAYANPQAPLYNQLPESVRKAGVIRIASDDYPPYRMTDANGQMQGLETDLLRAMEPLLGVRIEQVAVAGGAAALAGVDVGRYDFITGPALSSPQREKRFDIVTWLISKPAFIVPTTSNVKATGLLDLCGARISLMSGSASEFEVDTLSKKCTELDRKAITKISLPDQNASRLAAQSGRADAFSTALAAGLYLQKIRPNEYSVVTDDIDIFETLHLGAVFKRGSPLTPVFAAAMQKLVDSGEYETILENYGLRPAKVDRIVINVSTNPQYADQLP